MSARGSRRTVRCGHATHPASAPTAPTRFRAPRAAAGRACTHTFGAAPRGRPAGVAPRRPATGRRFAAGAAPRAALRRHGVPARRSRNSATRRARRCARRLVAHGLQVLDQPAQQVERAAQALVAGFEHRKRLLEARIGRAHMRQRNDDPIRHAAIVGAEADNRGLPGLIQRKGRLGQRRTATATSGAVVGCDDCASSCATTATAITSGSLPSMPGMPIGQVMRVAAPRGDAALARSDARSARAWSSSRSGRTSRSRRAAGWLR